MGFLWSWIRWLAGYEEIEILGSYGEKLVTLCMKNGVEIWQIRRVCPGIIRARISLFSKKKVSPLAIRCGVTVEFLRDRGLPALLFLYRRRAGLFLGIVLYCLMMAVLPGFVWSVEIPGADPVRSMQIRSILAEEGFGVGRWIGSVDFKDLRYRLMLCLDDLGFVIVNMEGSRAVVLSHFRGETPEIDEKTPCNLVASRDGQIISVLVNNGIRYVQKGQTVQAGDLLVGGICDTRLGYYVVHAKAEILARVADRSEKTVPLKQTVYRRTGKKRIQREWSFYGNTVPGFSQKVPYVTFDAVTERRVLSLGDQGTVPIILTETVYYETIPVDLEYTPEEGIALARAALNETERIRLYDATVESESETVIQSEDSVTVTRVRSLIVDICEEKEFYFDDEGY